MDDDREKELTEQLDEEAPPTEEEVRAARALASSTDRLLSGDSVEGPVDDLVAAAQMIRTSMVEQHLPASRRDSLIDEALQQSRARRAPARMRRLAPYLALAASVVLVLASLVLQTRPGGPTRPERSPAQQLSRPSNDLMGQPFSDRAGASRRLDLVFADRLSGYREVRLLAVRTPEMRGTP